MIEAKINNPADGLSPRVCTVSLDGSSVDLAAEFVCIAIAIYQNIKAENPFGASIFKRGVLAALSATDPDVWDLKEDEPPVAPPDGPAS